MNYAMILYFYPLFLYDFPILLHVLSAAANDLSFLA